jgi:hypothetical protein
MDELALITGPVHKDLTVYRGDSLRVEFRLRKCSGSYLVLTGLDGRATIRLAKDDNATPVTLAVAVDQTSGPTRGTVVVTATPQQTLVFPQVGVWDLELHTTDGTFRKTVVAGRLQFTRDVTM